VSFGEPTFDLRSRQLDATTTVVEVEGELHLSTAPAFRTALESAVAGAARAVILDLQAVTFIDSTGLSVLLTALRQVERSGGRLAVVCSNPTVLRLFEITSLDTTFHIEPTLEAALEHVRATA